MRAIVLSCVICLWTAVSFAAEPSVAYLHGQWWDGTRFVARTVYSVGRVLAFKKPARIGKTVDLKGQFVIPPLAEGHNHWLEAAKLDQYNACYLADGVFYVRDMANVPVIAGQIAPRLNRDDTVDWTSAMMGFTGPGAHPVEVIDQFVHFGILPKDWKPDYDGQGEFVVTTEADIDARFPVLLAQKPALVKAFLSHSEHYAQSLSDPNTRGQGRGMDPAMLPHLVTRAHAAGLKIAVHVYTAADFRSAVAAGADEAAHLPGTGFAALVSDDAAHSSDAGPDPAPFLITDADAQAAAKAGMVVDTTLSWLSDLKDENAKAYAVARDQIVVPNLKKLRAAGIAFLIGSDTFRRDSVPELSVLKELGQFSDVELLNLATDATPHVIFPKRRIGKLADGYEANFLVLARDPAANLDNLNSITERVKWGRALAVPAEALHRKSPDCVEGAP
jgi:hypothetical protein